MSKRTKRAGRGRKAPGSTNKSQGGGKPETLKKLALYYASNGLRVVPMHTIQDGRCSCHKGANCKNPGKHPTTAHGVKDATTDRNVIKLWWAAAPQANVGIAPGEQSKILVIDIDRRSGGFETMKKLDTELGSLPETVMSKTGGKGRHLVFAYPSARIRKDTAGKRLGAGVDILSDGSIMVAPPSRHASGSQYKWATGKSFKDIKPALLPDKWLAKLTDDPAVAEPTKVTTDTIIEGARNTTLMSFAGTLQRSGFSREAISAALVAENKAKCNPPLDDAEVEKIVDSVTQYPVPPGGDRADDAEKLVTLVLSQHFKGGEHLRFGADARFWLYSGKLWKRADEKWIDGRILETIKAVSLRTSQRTSSLISQVRTLMAAQLATNGDPFGFLAEPPRVINCTNGEVWIADDGTTDFREHRPESHLRHMLDVSYDRKAKCKEYDRAILEIFSKTDKPKAMRRHWNEFVGYLIQPRRNIPLIAVLLGSGDNGKTMLTRTIVKLMGLAQVQAQRVEELDSSRFAMGDLLGKLLFLDDDVRAGARLPDGTLKRISEAKEISGEVKYKSSFVFVVRTVPMLLCNNVPSLADVSHGMLKRLMVVPFDRKFTGKEQDDKLFERIWSNELPGVLNKALKGYRRLLKRGRFEMPDAITEAKASWLREANPVPAFIDERCIKRPDAKCLMTDLYPAYKKWATEAGFTMVQNQITLGRNLEHLGFKKTRATGGYQAIAGLELKR